MGIEEGRLIGEALGEGHPSPEHATAAPRLDREREWEDAVVPPQRKDPEKTLAYGSRLVESVLKDDAAMLNQLAWSIIAPEAPKADARAVKLALKAAQRSDEL